MQQPSTSVLLISSVLACRLRSLMFQRTLEARFKYEKDYDCVESFQMCAREGKHKVLSSLAR